MVNSKEKWHFIISNCSYLDYRVPLSLWFHHFLDFRAEICQIFSLFFWKIEDTKKSFWNQLTFNISELLWFNFQIQWLKFSKIFQFMSGNTQIKQIFRKHESGTMLFYGSRDILSIKNIFFQNEHQVASGIRYYMN